MGILEKIKGWFDMLLKRKAKEKFNTESVTSTEMDQILEQCTRIYQGKPEWLDKDDHIKTINFAKAVCTETARLTTLAIGIKLEGSARATWLQQETDKVYFKLRNWVEYGCAFGTVILKPNGKSIDICVPGRFVVTDQSNGSVTGCVFSDGEMDSDEKRFYTRLEYHRFLEDGLYAITNKCYVGKKMWDTEKEIDIKKTPWAGLQEHVEIENVEQPLFAVLKMPNANNVDVDSPLGLPIFSEAIEELKDLDIAYSRNSKEILDSKRMLLLDSDRLMPSHGVPVAKTASEFEQARKEMKLPDYVKNVHADDKESFYQEVNPTLQTETRLTGINALLSQIGYKIGYSNGYFVFNEKTGAVTATQVESDDRRTIQFIKDIRDKLESCLNELYYALGAFADLYGLAPSGTYKVTYNFGDITYNREEDRARWWSYVVQNRIPFWYFLVKFEGFTEKEAKALEQQAQVKEKKDWFGDE